MSSGQPFATASGRIANTTGHLQTFMAAALLAVAWGVSSLLLHSSDT